MTDHARQLTDRKASKTSHTNNNVQESGTSDSIFENIQNQLGITPGGKMNPQLIMQLQRTIGNQAVANLLTPKAEIPSHQAPSSRSMRTLEFETDESSENNISGELLQRTSMEVKTGLLSKKHRIYDSSGAAIATVAGGEVLNVSTDSTSKTKKGKKTVEVLNAQDAASFSFNPGGLGVGGSDGFFIKASNLKPAKVKEDGQPSEEEEELSKIQTGRTGHTGVAEQAMAGASVAAGAYSIKAQGEELASGIQAGNFDDKIDEEEQSQLFTRFNALGEELTGSLESVGMDTAVADDFMLALNNSQAMVDKIMDIAGKGIPIAGAVIKLIVSADSAWTGWKIYSAWKGAAKEAIDILSPSEDMSGDMSAPLLKVEPSAKRSATYAQAKSLRALVSKIMGFATSIAKAIGEIAALFTGGLGNLVSLSASILKSVGTVGRWLKALYKIAQNTKGKNRESHTEIVLEAANSNDETMLKTLIDLELTDDIWMSTLAAKMGTTYNPETDGAGWLAKKKGQVVGAASKQATNIADKVRGLGKDLGKNGHKLAQFGAKNINEQFIEGATAQSMEILLNQPKSPEDMYKYLQELQVVGAYDDYVLKVRAAMKSQ